MITLQLSNTEARDLQALIDAGLRHLGIRAAMAAAMINQKLLVAVENSATEGRGINGPSD